MSKRAKKAKVEEELPFKVSGHFLVPKHELLTPEQAAELLKKFNATPEQFPYISAVDSAAKEIGAKPGDFIKITRRSETAGEGFYYRYVVEA